MKFLVVLAIAVSCVAARRYERSVESDAPIVRSTYDISPEGNSFQYAYETGNGIVSQSEGVLKNPTSDNAALEVKGSVRYSSPDGTPVTLEWVANENGYQATGSHIPQAPAVPELILRSLQYIASHPPAVERVFNKP